MTERPHGYTRYKIDGCRCYTCGLAHSLYREHRAKAITAGTWQPYIDAEAARQHVLQLKLAGLGDRTIAGLAHLERCQIRALVHGRADRGTPPPRQIRPATAAAILTIEPTLDVLPAALLISAVGSHRRLQALGRNGWPNAQIARRLGRTEGGYSNLSGQVHVTARQARKVRALYDELWRANPMEHGVTLQARNRAVNSAKVNGWAPVGAWDDESIDDPDAAPDWTGLCGTPTGYKAHYHQGLTPVCAACRAARAAAYQASKQAA